MKATRTVLWVFFVVVVFGRGLGGWGDSSPAYATAQEPAQQETVGQEQTIVGHEIVENWSGSEDFYLVRFSTSQPVPGGEFLAFVSKDILDDRVTVASLFWHDDDPSGTSSVEESQARVLAQAQLVVQDVSYLIAPYRPHSTSYSYLRLEEEFDLQRAFVEYLSSIGVDKFNFYGHGGGGQIALILAGELPHLVRTIGVSSPHELFPSESSLSPIDRVAELPDVPILIVHDRLNAATSLDDISAYVLAVEGAGLSVRLVNKTTFAGVSPDSTPHYGTMALLGRELHKHLPVHRYDRVIGDGSVSAEILAELREDMDLSRAYAKKHLGIDSPPSDVFIGNDPEWLADRYLEAFKLPEGFRQGKVTTFSKCGPAEGGFTAMFIPACNVGWLTGPREGRTGGIAHEWWHVNVQFFLLNTFCCSGGDSINIYGPQWLIEGSAEVWSSLVLNNFTNDLEWEKAWRREQVPVGFDLLALNTRQGWRDAPERKYEARDLAVWLLVDMAGLSGLEDFYRRLGEYIAVEAAKNGLDPTHQSPQVRKFRSEFFPERYQKLNEIFGSAFGRTLDEFGAGFSEYLRTGELSALMNRVPQIISKGPFEVEENTTSVGRLEAVDRDQEDEVTAYGIAGGADGGLFAIVEETGELSFREAPDYENPGDVESQDPPSAAGDNEYILVVEVTSGEGERERTREMAIRVRVRDVEMEEETESLFIPVILSSAGRNNSYFTSELTLTNRGSQDATLRYTYTADAGGGSGTASDRLPAGSQKIEIDALTYLAGLGIPIAETGSRIGTLRVEVPLKSAVSAVVRTTTVVPDGRAGLAYPGVAEEQGFSEPVYLCGLRQNQQDRSNVALQNMGALEEGSITLKTTVYSGEAADTRARVLDDVELEPGEFQQFNQVLNVLGSNANGYVKVERVEGEAPFYAYGVINDQVNSDGSFVFPVTAGSLEGKRSQTLPVVVETRDFTSELTVTNFSEAGRTLELQFVAEGNETAAFSMDLEAGEQQIIPEVVEELRRKVAGPGSGNRTLAGPVFVTAKEGDLRGIVVGARTGSKGGGGQYSVFYTAVPEGEGFGKEAWVEGLQQNEENRSNLALVNTGEVDGSESVFHLEIYNGETGMLEETVVTKPIPARRWHQINGILGRASAETRQGYIRIRKISGDNPFLAYGVVNDGGAPGERSGDGSYLPAGE